jgi:hypothetical protein
MPAGLSRARIIGGGPCCREKWERFQGDVGIGHAFEPSLRSSATTRTVSRAEHPGRCATDAPVRGDNADSSPRLGRILDEPFALLRGLTQANLSPGFPGRFTIISKDQLGSTRAS